jgi:hypothetical protein
MRVIPRARLVRQHLTKPAKPLSAVALVTTFGAMQAQEYEHAKWAVGLRAPGTSASDIEAALAAGALLRSHPMRGTHHFVARDDLRWLMALMGPLMIQRNARRNRELELDEKTLGRAMTVLQRALEGGTHLTRAEVATVLSRARIASDGQRLSHIIYRAELESLACSGARKGKQITIALFDERVPASKPRSREACLRELATRYFTTRGPATQDDFRWWCQLPAADARAAIDLAAPDADGEYYAIGSVRPVRATSETHAVLLPPYDEYTVAYKDRSAAGAPPANARTFGETTLLGPTIVIEGTIVGSWRRTVKRTSVTVDITPWTTISTAAHVAIDNAIARYQAFYAS